MAKVKAANLLVQKKLAADLTTAKKLIMAGLVHTADNLIQTAGELIDENKEIIVKSLKTYVSRGGEKLERAIYVFNLDFKNKVVLDIGSSTGGFSDCCLQFGAQYVYCVDVGTNQLAFKLRNDKRVQVIENTNLKAIEPSMFNKNIDIVLCDVSFISVKHVFKAIENLCNTAMILIKPQYEAKRDLTSKTLGLVSSKSIHEQVIEQVKAYGKKYGYNLLNICESPIKGKVKGNTEYLSLWSK